VGASGSLSSLRSRSLYALRISRVILIFDVRGIDFGLIVICLPRGYDMDGLAAGFGAVHEHHKEQNRTQSQADNPVSLFAIILDKVVFPGYVVRVAEHLYRRLKRDPVNPKILTGLCRVPRESRFHIPLSYI